MRVKESLGSLQLHWDSREGLWVLKYKKFGDVGKHNYVAHSINTATNLLVESES